MKIEDLGVIVGIWAHPDDETFGTGGIMAIARENGQKVVCITATKGELGVRDEAKWPKGNLSDIRSQEMHQSMQLLGVDYHHWLGYKDGDCKYVAPNEALKQILPLIDQYQPDTIITFSPDGMTGHPDHCAVSYWSSLIAQQRGISMYYVIETQEQYDAHWSEVDSKHNIYFNIDKPTLLPCSACDICVVLPEHILGRKVGALQAMASQTDSLFEHTDRSKLSQMLSMEALVRADRKDINWGKPYDDCILE